MSRAARPPTAAQVRAWPVTVDVPTAGRCWGMSRTSAYRAARSGELAPGVPVLRLGRRLVVTRAALLAALGIAERDSAVTDSAPGRGVSGQVPDAAGLRSSDARGAA